VERRVSQFSPGIEPDDTASDETGMILGHCFAFVGSDLLFIEDSAASPRIPTWSHLRAWGLTTVRHQYLGILDHEPCWSVELEDNTAPPPGATLTGIRALYERLSEVEYALAGRAIQVIAWERDHQFCGRCATPTERVPGERARRCPACGLTSYPRISPAVIVLIERGDRILLARGHAFVPGRFGIVAGFVEPGESLEEAVAREVQEEVGIELADIRYFGSQPWPFPHGIMIGFRARSLSESLTIDGTELAEAGWYSVDDLPIIPGKLSIARRLIDAWACEHGVVIDQP
jgi:NAD+ diphosphatase